MLPRALKSSAFIVLLAIGATACSRSEAAAGPVGPPATAVAVPKKLGELTSHAEKGAIEALGEAAKKATKAGADPYVTDSAVYALRLGKELKGVLQISRMRSDAEPGVHTWRIAIARQIGRGPVKNPLKIGGVNVYERFGNGQRIYLWFRGHMLFVLIIRQEEGAPATSLGFDPAPVLEDAVALSA